MSNSLMQPFQNALGQFTNSSNLLGGFGDNQLFSNFANNPAGQLFNGGNLLFGNMNDLLRAGVGNFTAIPNQINSQLQNIALFNTLGELTGVNQLQNLFNNSLLGQLFGGNANPLSRVTQISTAEFSVGTAVFGGNSAVSCDSSSTTPFLKVNGSAASSITIYTPELLPTNVDKLPALSALHTAWTLVTFDKTTADGFEMKISGHNGKSSSCLRNEPTFSATFNQVTKATPEILTAAKGNAYVFYTGRIPSSSDFPAIANIPANRFVKVDDNKFGVSAVVPLQTEFTADKCGEGSPASATSIVGEFPYSSNNGTAVAAALGVETPLSTEKATANWKAINISDIVIESPETAIFHVHNTGFAFDVNGDGRIDYGRQININCGGSGLNTRF